MDRDAKRIAKALDAEIIPKTTKKMGRRKYLWFRASNNSLRICHENKWQWRKQ